MSPVRRLSGVLEGACARFWPLLTLLVLGAITYLSLSPLERLPEAPGGDKLHHLAAYGLLALPASLARPRGWGWLLLLFILWGGAIELLQPFVQRYAELGDFIANFAGVGLGCLLGWLLRLRARAA